MSTSRVRMSGAERREQLIAVGRAVFAARGVAAATVEEVAAAAGVTKPVVYEHFGGKEGLYAVIVDRETRNVLDHVASAFDEDASPRALLEATAVALLQYISENPDGFRVLVRDAPSWHSTGSLASLMSDIATQVTHELSRVMSRREIDTRYAPLYAQMLVGMVALTGDWWLEHGHEFTADEVAAHLTNLAWNGLTGLEASPRLQTGILDGIRPAEPGTPSPETATSTPDENTSHGSPNA